MPEWEDQFKEDRRKAEEIRDRAEQQEIAWGHAYHNTVLIVDAYDLVDRLKQQESQPIDAPPPYLSMLLERGDTIEALHKTVMGIPEPAFVDSMATSTGSILSVDVMGLADAVTFNTQQRAIIDNYADHVKVEDAISRIRSDLPTIDSGVAEDFEEFLRNYQNPGPKRTKYQVLVGFRSPMFLKLIGRTAQEHGIREKKGCWADKARAFVLGSGTAPDRITEKTIEETAAKAAKLWTDLSTDTKSGEKGARHVERVYKDAMLILNALLAQHKAHYRRAPESI